MSRRFTERQLYEVRNHIPIRHVIETLLAMDSETVDGVFRFRCPLCAGRNTAVNPKTNLSRCFHCGKNFNAIDLYMIVSHRSFVDSVKFLIEHQGQLPPAASKPACPEGTCTHPKKAPLKRPVALNEILCGLMDKAPRQVPTTIKQELPPASPTAIEIAELERIIHDLSQVLQHLKAGCRQK
jgi:hypothetical protein